MDVVQTLVRISCQSNEQLFNGNRFVAVRTMIQHVCFVFLTIEEMSKTRDMNDDDQHSARRAV
jgi:hypothetical protein